jgi:trk system potassium uptake protein TrkA
MKIVILGAGDTGSYAAAILSQDHDVTLLDQNPKVLEQVSRETDIETVLTSGSGWKVLASLAERRPDFFFAATGHDETNLVSCALAKNLGFPKTAARIKSLEYLQCPAIDLARLFYADHLIGAEMLAAQNLLKTLVHSGDVAFEHFAHGAVLMRTVSVPQEWEKGETPIHSLKLPDGLIACLIRRRTASGERVLIPHGDDSVQPGDEITLAGGASAMEKIDGLFAIPEQKLKSVIIVGGSSAALHLSHFLIQHKVAVRIVEKNSARCLQLADQLPKATIINRDGLDPNILIEEQVQDADALVSCTADDGTNLLIASLAQRQGCPRTVALANNPAYFPVIEGAGVIPAVSPRVTIANRLLSILHEGTILSVTPLANNAAKIVEVKVPSSSRLVGVPLADLAPHLPKDLLIAVIETRGKVAIGRGNSILCPDDTVVAISGSHEVESLCELFGVQ